MSELNQPIHHRMVAALSVVRSRWALMTFYERFEQLVAIALSLIIAALIVIALVQLYERILPLVLGGALNPLNHEVFQSIFGSIFTVLIAMEFKHSIIKTTMRRDSIVQVRTVVLIALLAMSRKFVHSDLVLIHMESSSLRPSKSPEEMLWSQTPSATRTRVMV